LQNSEALGPAANTNTTVRMVARNTTSSHPLPKQELRRTGRIGF
jgi:hypothetical protein